MGILFSGVLRCSVSFSPQYHRTKGERGGGGGELLVAKPLIASISNKATGMFNKSEPLETYPSEGFRWNRVKPSGMRLDVVWTCGTRSRYE